MNKKISIAIPEDQIKELFPFIFKNSFRSRKIVDYKVKSINAKWNINWDNYEESGTVAEVKFLNSMGDYELAVFSYVDGVHGYNFISESYYSFIEAYQAKQVK